MTIFKYAVIRGVRNRLSFIINFVLPFVVIFIRPVWTEKNSMGFYFIAMLIMYGSFLMARGILTDRLDGTITRILAGPVTTLGYLTQNLLACMVPISILIIIICFIGKILYAWGITLLILLILCYTVFAAASVTFSFAWSCLFKNKEASYAIFSTLMSVVAMVSGLWFPIEIMPNALRYVGALFPAYWAANGINALLTDGVTAEYWLSLAAIAFFAVAYLLYGGKRKIA